MSMNQVPTLVLGIGGVGCKIAAAISDSLSTEDRKYVGVIGLDTNVNDLARLKEKHRMEIIQTSDDQEVSVYLENHPEYCEWFPENDFLRERTMTDGAGQIRTLSRLACLAASESGRFEPILKEITRIRRIDGNPHNKSLTIMIVGSITGGTGAGLFLHMPFYIRNLIKTQVGIKHCIIRGMFVGPDVLEEVQPSQINKDAVCVNGYTCLKELNAFYMRPVVGKKISNNLRLDFYDHENTSTQNIPYNYLYLVEKSAKLGAMGDTKVDEIINYIAHIVFTLLFSPVTADALSIEDNFIMSMIGAGGMNRYAGAGMCKLSYPLETAQEYVTLKVVHDLVQKEWLLIDRSYDAIAKAARTQQKTDGRTEVPKIKDSYVSIFEEQVKGDHAALGALLNEAYIEKDHEYIPRSNDFINALDTMVEDLLSSEDVTAAKERCNVNAQNMKKFSTAESEINNVWEAMCDFVKLTKSLIDSKPISFANSLFPPTWEVMEYQKEKPECIYSLLASVHPVTARFFIYKLINQLEENISELKVAVMGVELNAYKDEDFDSKREGSQGPGETLSVIKTARNPIWKMLGPIGEVVNSEEKAISKLKRKLMEVAESHVQVTHEYLENSIKLEVSKIVLERLVQLADNYSIFFSTVSAKIERNNENIARLENLNFPYGQEGIYCSEQAFRRMADEYMDRQPLELSEDTKKAIFEQIYLVQARRFTASAVSETKAQKEKRIQEAKAQLETVFNYAVVDTIHTSVVEKGMGIVNLTAREALRKEYELVSGKIPADFSTMAEYEENVKLYVQDRLETAMKIATPMLATDSYKSDTELRFLAVHPTCSQTDHLLQPSVAETNKFYFSHFAASTTVLINKEFKETELTCLRLAYDFTIEELTKYKDGSRNAIAYKERIANLNVKRPINYNSEEMVVVVNPHLNCHWHEEGFIPDIQGKKRTQDHIDILKAFVYAMGLDSFKLIEDDDHPDDEGRPRPTWYAYTNGCTQINPIMKCGKLIGNGYHDVFNALPYNGVLKAAVLRDAKNAVEKMKGYTSADELFDEILDNRFVQDLIQVEDEKLNDNDLNIFDIFMDMKSHMPEENWNELFDGLLITLWEFCGVLFDESEIQVNKAVAKILKAIYDNSSVGMGTSKASEKSKNMLKIQYEIMLKKKYKK